MSLKDTATVLAYHQDRIARFGVDTTEALGWKCLQSQQQRFSALAGLGDFSGRSVLDIGCGHGDFYPFIAHEHPSVEYIGLDNDRSFLEVAVTRFGSVRNTFFLAGEFATVKLPRADFVICCGALNYRSSDAGYLENMIGRFFAVCNLGLGLNLLSHVDFEAGILTPYDPETVAEFCLELTPNVELVAGPEQDHFTLFLRR
jgi:SAM-dependent methyltransferase